MAYLVLSNGRVFEGERFGAEKDSTGLLVFTTTVGSYVETLTDPCYYGQIIMQTFPLAGNYGWTGDMEKDTCYAAGYVVREWCDAPSNFRCKGDLDAYLKAQGVPGICGVDTRELTQIIREEGVLTARICSSLENASELENYTVKLDGFTGNIKEATPGLYTGEPLYRAAMLHLGADCGVTEELGELGCQVTAFPGGSDASAVLSGGFGGVIISDGPGDPADYGAAVDNIKQLLGKAPVFGFGLGHQLIAMAAGGSVSAMKFGHHGANQPVKDTATGRILVTGQNHLYTVDAQTVSGGELTHINLNDSTCEGLYYPEHNAFSVQFRPDRAVLERFIALMGGKN